MFPPVNALAYLIGVGYDEFGADASSAAEITWLETCDSTNSELRRRIELDPTLPAGTTIVAAEQTAGRGRLGRDWASSPGDGLWMSTLVRLPGCRAASWLPLLVGLAGQRASTLLCPEVEGQVISLKWPNDVVADGKKLAGILVEALPEAYVVGIGLNLRSTVYPGAIGLQDLARQVTREQAFEQVHDQLQSLIKRWRLLDWATDELAQEYIAACASIGTQVTITESDGEVWSGVGVGLDAAGHLMVKTDTDLRTVIAADVVHATIDPCTPKNS